MKMAVNCNLLFLICFFSSNKLINSADDKNVSSLIGSTEKSMSIEEPGNNYTLVDSNKILFNTSMNTTNELSEKAVNISSKKSTTNTPIDSKQPTSSQNPANNDTTNFTNNSLTSDKRVDESNIPVNKSLNATNESPISKSPVNNTAINSTKNPPFDDKQPSISQKPFVDQSTNATINLLNNSITGYGRGREKSKQTADNSTQTKTESPINKKTTENLEDFFLKNSQTTYNSNENKYDLIDPDLFTSRVSEIPISTTTSTTTKRPKTTTTPFRLPSIPTFRTTTTTTTKKPPELNALQNLLLSTLNVKLGPLSLSPLVKTLSQMPLIREMMDQNRPLDFVNPYSVKQ